MSLLQLDRLAKIQAQNTELRAARKEVADAPRPLPELSTITAPMLDSLAAEFRPDVRRLLQSGEAPSFSLTGRSAHEAVSERALVTVLAKFCRRDLERALLDCAREELAVRPAGLPAAERAARLVELDRAILQLERQEERLVRECERSGIDVWRRVDADPATVLAEDAEIQERAA